MSGKLMTKNANGKLQLHRDAVSNKAEIADNDIKLCTGAIVNEDGKLTRGYRTQADTAVNADQDKTPSSTVMAGANDPSAKTVGVGVMWLPRLFGCSRFQAYSCRPT